MSVGLKLNEDFFHPNQNSSTGLIMKNMRSSVKLNLLSNHILMLFTANIVDVWLQ